MYREVEHVPLSVCVQERENMNTKIKKTHIEKELLKESADDYAWKWETEKIIKE